MPTAVKKQARQRRAQTPRPRRLTAVLRVSRRNGRDGDAFHSPEIQRRKIEAWAAANDVEIVSWYDETDSVSGRTTDRPGLRSARTEVLGHRPGACRAGTECPAVGHSDGIIVARVDRFSRSHIEGLSAIHELHTHGKAFVAVDDGIDGRDPKALGPRIMLDLLLRLAEWQLETLTDGWEEAITRHVEKGIAGTVPYGYRRNDDDRRLEPDPVTAPFVKGMFARRAKGDSYMAIARWLNDEGAPTGHGAAGWVHGSVQHVLHNRAYLGELRGAWDQINTKAHPPLVTRAQWDAAQVAAERTPSRTKASAFPLTGVLRCATCGGRMAGQTEKPKPNRLQATPLRYYRCRTRYQWGTCPTPAMVPADDVERLVFDRLHADYVSRRLWKGTTTSADLDAALAAEDDARAAYDAWSELPSTRRLAALDPARCDRTTDRYLDDIEEASKRVAEVRSEIIGAQMPANLIDAWPTMDVAARRALIAIMHPVVAVGAVRTRGRRTPPVPVESRVRIWGRDDADIPTELPGLGGALGKDAVQRPIDLDG